AAGRPSLRVKLEGAPPNTQAAGARIIATIGGTKHMREIIIGSNYTSQNPTVQIFGLGDSETVDELLVEWPPVVSEDGLERLGSLITGPIAPSRPGQTLVSRHPRLGARWASAYGWRGKIKAANDKHRRSAPPSARPLRLPGGRFELLV